MKKIYNTLTVTLAAALSLSLAGCTTAGKISSDESAVSKTNPEKVSFEWQDAFENKIKEYKSSDDFSDDSRFDIADITGNGTPELIISPNSETSTRCTIYTFENNSLNEAASIGNCGKLLYCPDRKTITDEYIGDGFVIGQILSYSNGSMKTEISYSDNSASASMGATISHEINGEEVMLPEYEKALSEYVCAALVDAGRRFTFSDASIEYAVKYSQSWLPAMSAYQKDLCRAKLEELADTYAAMSSILNPAFDFCDLNGDLIPELIVSDGSEEHNICSVYYFSGDSLIPMDGTYGNNGIFSFDREAFVFFGSSNGKKTYWSIANNSFSENEYKESGSIIQVGRKYTLTRESLSAVFG